VDDRATTERWFASVPLHRALGLRLAACGPGTARIAIEAGPTNRGGVGDSVHGGVLAAVVDVAMLTALSPLFGPDDVPAGTVDLNITYLRPARGATVFAEASVLRKGKRLAVTEVSVIDGDGMLCARGRAIYAIRSRSGGQDVP
jgi:uncharacterized protein (TIGR00369 family)